MNTNAFSAGGLRVLVLSLLTLAGAAKPAQAWPVVDRPVPTGSEPVKVYPDEKTPGVYWYMPISIDPWSRDSRYRSAIYENENTLSFIFRGQASVDEKILSRVASAIGTSVHKLVPISFEYSKDLICQNFFVGDPRVQWITPKAIGNFLEIVPISLRVTGSELVKEISSLLHSTGLGCHVTIGHRIVSTGYRLEMTADFNRVYDRFESSYGGKFFWWQSDIHAMVEHLRRDGVITLTTLEDTSIPSTELDKKVQAAMDQVVKQITDQLFVPQLKLPNEPMVGRGKGFSLRTDYRRSAEKARFKVVLQADKVHIREDTIGIRMALE